MILAKRTGKSLSRRQLGDAAGYAGANTGVTINKIERGELRPSDERLHAIANVLGLSHAEVDAAGKRSTRNPAAVAQARKANRQRIAVLNEDVEALRHDAERHYAPLEQARTRLEDSFLGPFLEFAARLKDADDEVERALNDLVEFGPKQTPLQLQIEHNLSDITNSLGRAIARPTTTKEAPGAAFGGGAAFGTYSAVAASASASTGTAVSSLAGVSASNATLTALGGYSLAAGGLGFVGGHIALATIVASPALIATGVSLLWASKKWSEKARDESFRIAHAEKTFRQTAERIRGSFPWTEEAQKYLSLAEATSSRLLGLLNTEELSAAKVASWTGLNEHQQEATLLGSQLAAVALTILPLPVIPTPEDLSAPEIKKIEHEAQEWNTAVLQDATARTESIFADAVLLGRDDRSTDGVARSFGS